MCEFQRVDCQLGLCLGVGLGRYLVQWLLTIGVSGWDLGVQVGVSGTLFLGFDLGVCEVFLLYPFLMVMK